MTLISVRETGGRQVKRGNVIHWTRIPIRKRGWRHHLSAWGFVTVLIATWVICEILRAAEGR